MHKVNIPTALAFAAILAAPATTSAAPKIVNVQYYSTGGGDGQTGNASMVGQQGIVASTDATPYWNQFTAGGYGWIPSATADMTNRTLYLTDDSAGLVDSGIRLSGQRAQCSVNGNTGIPLFRGGIYATAGDGNGDGKSITLTLSGLTVGQTYDLYVYGASPIYNGNPTITVTGSAQAVKSTVFNTSTTAYSTDNTAEFTGILPASDGTLTIVASHPTLYFGINGFTLVSDSGATPAPVIAIEEPEGINIPNGGSDPFGTVLVGAYTDHVFTLKNTGTADLTVSTPTLSGANAADFTVTVNPAATVAAASNTTFTVRFTPTVIGAETAAVQIVNNDGTNSTFNISLSGTGHTIYNDWATAFTGPPLSNTAPGADPDNDGHSNLYEFAFNGDPRSGSDSGKVFVFTTDNDSSKKLILTVAVRAGTPDFAGSPPAKSIDGITYTIRGSTDLSGFSQPVAMLATPVTTGLPAAGTGYQYRSFSLDGSAGLPAKGFLHAEVTQP